MTGGLYQPEGAWCALAEFADASIWRLSARLAYDKERDRLKGYWRRQPLNTPTGDFEP